MAYNNFFDEIDNCMGVSSFCVIRHTVPAEAGPTIIRAVGTIQVSITIYDVLMICTAAAGAETMTVQTAIGGGGAANLSSAIAQGAVGVIGRTATIVAAQAVVGPADAVQVVHSAATTGGVVHLLAYLT